MDAGQEPALAACDIFRLGRLCPAVADYPGLVLPPDLIFLARKDAAMPLALPVHRRKSNAIAALFGHRKADTGVIHARPLHG